MRRLRRWLVRIAAVAAVLVVLAAAALWVASRTGLVRAWVRGQVIAVLHDALHADVRLGGVGGTVGRSLVLTDLRVAVAGHTVARVERVEVTYSILSLFRDRLRLGRVTLVRPWIRAVRDAGGWRLPEIGGEGGGDAAVTIRRLIVRDGRVAVSLPGAARPRRLAAAAIEAEARAVLDPGAWQLEIEHLGFVPRGIDVSPVEARARVESPAGGVLALRDVSLATARSRLSGWLSLARGQSVAGHLETLPLAAREVRAVVPDSGLIADVHALVDVDGPWSAVRLDLRTALGDGGRLGGTATVDLAASPPVWAARVRLDEVDPGAVRAGLPRGRLVGRARARGRGLSRTAPVSYRLALAGSRLANRDIERATLAGAAAGGVHRLRAAAAVPAGAATATARVDLGERLAYEVEADLAVRDLEVLAGVPGRVSAKVGVKGGTRPAGGQHATLRATLDGGAIRDVALRKGVLEATLDGDVLTVGTARLEADGLRATAGGRLTLGETPALDARASADLDLRPLTAAAFAGGAHAEATARGPFAGLTVAATVTANDVARGGVRIERAATAVRIEGVGGPPPARGELERLDLAFSGLPSWRLASPARFRLEEGVAADSVTLVSGEQRIAFAGRIAAHGANAAALDLGRLRLREACALVLGDECEGTIGGRVEIGGTAAAPEITVRLATSALGVGGVGYGTATLDAAYAERQVQLTGVASHPQAGSVHLDGTIPIDLAWEGERRDLSTAPVALALTARHLDVAFVRALAATEIRQVAGRVSMDLRLTGPRAAPRVEGGVTLEGGRLELIAAGVVYEDIRVRLAAAGGAVEVTELHARGGKGTIDGGGRITMKLPSPVLEVRATAKSFFVLARPAYEVTVSGGVALRGTLARPDLTGDLDVERAIIRPAALPASEAELEPDPTITVIGAGAEPGAQAEARETGIDDPFRIALDLHFVGATMIRRRDAQIDVRGDLRLDKEPFGPLRLIGEIRLVRGWYAFQGRRFELDEGTVRFTGSAPPAPIFDVSAVYRTREYRITVTVTGHADKPSLALASDPPLSDADILAVLLFGKPTGELGQGEAVGLQRQAVGLAAGYVAPDLESSVMSTLGVDALDVELPQGQDIPGRVRVGRYVAPDVFLSLAQQFGARAGQEVGLEYGLTRGISVRGSTSTLGDSAIDVIWHRRY